MEDHRLMTVPRNPFTAILHFQGLPQWPTLTCPTFPFSESSELILSFLEGVSLHFLKVLLTQAVPALSSLINTKPRWSLTQSLKSLRFFKVALEQKAESPYSEHGPKQDHTEGEEMN